MYPFYFLFNKVMMARFAPIFYQETVTTMHDKHVIESEASIRVQLTQAFFHAVKYKYQEIYWKAL